MVLKTNAFTVLMCVSYNASNIVQLYLNFRKFLVLMQWTTEVVAKNCGLTGCHIVEFVWRDWKKIQKFSILTNSSRRFVSNITCI